MLNVCPFIGFGFLKPGRHYWRTGSALLELFRSVQTFPYVKEHWTLNRSLLNAIYKQLWINQTQGTKTFKRFKLINYLSSSAHTPGKGAPTLYKYVPVLDVVRLFRLSGAGWVGIDHHTSRTGKPGDGQRLLKAEKVHKGGQLVRVGWSGYRFRCAVFIG